MPRADLECALYNPGAGLKSQQAGWKDMWDAYGRCTAARDAPAYLAAALDLDRRHPLVRARFGVVSNGRQRAVLCAPLPGTAALCKGRLSSMHACGSPRLHRPPSLSRPAPPLPHASASRSPPCPSSPLRPACPRLLQPQELPAALSGADLEAAVQAAFGARPYIECGKAGLAAVSLCFAPEAAFATQGRRGAAARPQPVDCPWATPAQCTGPLAAPASGQVRLPCMLLRARVV